MEQVASRRKMEILAVTLPAVDADALEPFYRDVLGLATRRDGPALVVQAGDTALAFIPADDAPAPAHLAFDVASGRFLEAVDWAAARVDLLHEGRIFDFDVAPWHAHSVYFLDPADNVLELIARHREPAAPGAGPIVRVSEVGLPVADVAGTVEWLESALGIPYFDGDRRVFTAMGDGRGLLIVVADGRTWMPTDLRGRRGPLDVLVRGDAEGQHTVPGEGAAIRTTPR